MSGFRRDGAGSARRFAFRGLASGVSPLVDFDPNAGYPYVGGSAVTIGASDVDTLNTHHFYTDLVPSFDSTVDGSGADLRCTILGISAVAFFELSFTGTRYNLRWRDGVAAAEQTGDFDFTAGDTVRLQLNPPAGEGRVYVNDVLVASNLSAPTWAWPSSSARIGAREVGVDTRTFSGDIGDFFAV